MIQSARQIAPGVFVLDVSRCQTRLDTASNGAVDCLAYDYPSWREGRMSYQGDFELIGPGALVVLLAPPRPPVSTRISQVLEDADGDGEPVRILIGERLGG